jgi:hypothetical protein
MTCFLCMISVCRTLEFCNLLGGAFSGTMSYVLPGKIQCHELLKFNLKCCTLYLLYVLNFSFLIGKFRAVKFCSSNLPDQILQNFRKLKEPLRKCQDITGDKSRPKRSILTYGITRKIFNLKGKHERSTKLVFSVLTTGGLNLPVALTKPC